MKTSRRRGIIKIRAKNNEIEIKKIQRINKSKSCFFEKINKINKPLANMIKMRREIIQFSNEKGEIRTNTKKSRESSATTLRTYIKRNGKCRRNEQICRYL
jgi:hypothetical protein